MKRRILAFLLAFTLISVNIPAIFAFGEEAGTEQNPITIKTWEEFETFLNSNHSGNPTYYSLAEDITYIGTDAYGGYDLSDAVLEGNGHKISGIKLNSTLFDTVVNTAIRNVVFDDITFVSSEEQKDVAILANVVDFSSYITSCAFSNCVLTLPDACCNVTAGIVAAQNEGVITNCIVEDSCEIIHQSGNCSTSSHTIGGLVGVNTEGLIINSISYVKFDLAQNKKYVLGGITAKNQCIVEYCYSEVEAPDVNATFDALVGNSSTDGEIINCVYRSEGKYTTVGFSSIKDYNSMDIEVFAAEMTELSQNDYNQNYEFSMFSIKDLACPWTVENGKLSLSFDGLTAWVYVYLDKNLSNALLTFESEIGKKVTDSKYAFKVGSYCDKVYNRNSFEISYNTTRYMMVNNFVYSPINSYVTKLNNTADGLETNYSKMYLAPASVVVSGGDSKEDYVKNTSKGKIYPFGTELSLSNIGIDDELISLKFDGEGTEASPFQIKNGFDFQTLAKYVETGESYNGIPYNEAYYSMMNDIDLSGFSFGTIGSVGNNNKNAFRGVFDGKGNTISNYTINTTRSMQGIFGLVAGYPDNGNNKGKKAVVKNVLLENVAVKGMSGSYGDLRGALIGQAEYATVSGCFVDNTNTYMEGGTQIGGLIGYAYYCDIFNCGSSTKIVTHSGVAYAGGIVGNSAHSAIRNCYVNTNFVINNVTDKRFMCIGPVAGYIRNTDFDNNFYTEHSEINYGKVKGVSSVLLSYMQSEDFANALTVYSEKNSFGNIFKTRNISVKLPIPTPTDSQRAEYLVSCIPTDLGKITLSNSSGTALRPFNQTITVAKSEGNDSIKEIIITDLKGVVQNIKVKEEIAGEKYSFDMPNYPIYIIPKFADVYLKGEGNIRNPYQITTFEEFMYMASKVNEGNNSQNYKGVVYRFADYSLMTDIDFEGNGFEGIGTQSNPFKGYFYGNGHTISNAVFSKALFNYISGDFLIEGLELKNITVTENEGALFVYDGSKGTFISLNNIMATDCKFTGAGGSGLVYYGAEYGTYLFSFRMKNISYTGGGLTTALVKNTNYPVEAFYGVLINSSCSYLCLNLYDGSTFTFGYSYTYNTTFKKHGDGFHAYTEISEDELRNKDFIANLSASKHQNNFSWGWTPSIVDGYATIAAFEDKKAYYPISYDNVFSQSNIEFINMSSAIYGAEENETVTLSFNPIAYTGDLKITDKNGKEILYVLTAPKENETYGTISFIMPESNVKITNNGKSIKYYVFWGEGTKESPYIISTPEDLKKVADIINGTMDASSYHFVTEYNSAYFVLNEDLDMNGINWEGIGTSGTHFQGNFNGNGHTISNLNINSGRADGGRQGLFMILGTKAVVKNLTVKGANVWSESSPVRGSAAIAKENNGLISAVMVIDCTLQLGNWDFIGGIAGRNTSSGIIEYCGVVNTFLRYRWGGAGKFPIGALTSRNEGTLRNSYSYACSFANGNSNVNPLCPVGNEPLNCFYYTESTDDGKWSGKSFSKEDFNSGHVTYFGLNQANTSNPIWRQNLDSEPSDLYPFPFESHGIVCLYTTDSGEFYTNAQMVSSGLTLMLGDANLNGKVDAEDAVLLRRYLSGSESMSKNALVSCDVNKDGKVDKDDLKILSKYLDDGVISGEALIGKISELESIIPEGGALVGDINRDGMVNKNDLELFKDFLDGKIQLKGAEKLAANVDLSDGFDASDLQIIREYLDALAEERKTHSHVGQYVYSGDKEEIGDIPSPGDNSTPIFIYISTLILAFVLLKQITFKRKPI
ncbi:MAG: hypothetical protein E7614_05485 [Ruminococcaceae bacterium]|nr:hypothetical protein [Oscillospiraceae bacterium]